MKRPVNSVLEEAIARVGWFQGRLVLSNVLKKVSRSQMEKGVAELRAVADLIEKELLS